MFRRPIVIVRRPREEQLKEPAALHEAGTPSDEEFEAAKRNPVGLKAVRTRARGDHGAFPAACAA